MPSQMSEMQEDKLAEVRRAVPFRSYVLWKDASWKTVAYLEANRLLRVTEKGDK